MTVSHPNPVRYRPEIEVTAPDEAEKIASLQSLFLKMSQTVADHDGHASRSVHAKGQGLVRGRLDILDGLSPELAQGLFSKPGSYRTVIRLSSPPAEQLSDKVSTPRALALKVLNVEGERVAGGGGGDSQDFLMVNGPAFATPGIDGFLRSFKLLAATTEKAPRAKAALSKVMRGTEQLLEAAGTSSANIKQMGGQPQIHPLGETFFSQVPFLYGNNIAKFSLAPVSQELHDLDGASIANEENAQREAVTRFFSELSGEVVWELRVQLCRDLESMPIEDASVQWSEAQSPYLPVARLTLSRQEAWKEHASLAEEDRLAFSPWHCLAAHRPLGGLNRARKQVMATSREFRSSFNKCPLSEPSS